MSRNSSILIRFDSDGGKASAEPSAIDIESRAARGRTFALDTYSRERLFVIGRNALVVVLGVSLAGLLAFQTDRLPSSIRIPLMRSDPGSSSSGDWPSLSDLFGGGNREEDATGKPLDAPPPQDLEASLADAAAKPLPAAGPMDLLKLEQGQDDAGADGAEGVQIIGSPATPAPRAKPLALVTRGTFIPAILETPIEPGTPSGVRAIVPVDVAGRGAGMTVPKSSRLVGQYYAKESNGRQRVYIIWKQLILPGGKTGSIASGSIAKDKFFDSFGTASMISIVEPEGKDKALERVRTGEPLRIVTSRDVEVAGEGGAP